MGEDGIGRGFGALALSFGRCVILAEQEVWIPLTCVIGAPARYRNERAQRSEKGQKAGASVISRSGIAGANYNNGVPWAWS